MIDPLLKLAKKLRKECPWDKKQTLKTLPPMIIEEVEEIIQAVEKKDWENMKEEIGDVLFNLCLLMQIAEEKKYFTVQEIIDSAEEKIVSRHTWVYGKDKALTAEDAVRIWKQNKKKEKSRNRKKR